MGYCRASAVRLLEQELLSRECRSGKEAVNKAIAKSSISLDAHEKVELIHIANEQLKHDMIMQYFVPER